MAINTSGHNFAFPVGASFLFGLMMTMTVRFTMLLSSRPPHHHHHHDLLHLLHQMPPGSQQYTGFRHSKWMSGATTCSKGGTDGLPGVDGLMGGGNLPCGRQRHLVSSKINYTKLTWQWETAHFQERKHLQKVYFWHNIGQPEGSYLKVCRIRL